MRSLGIIGFIIGISLISCKTAEIILPGNLTGTVTDAETNMPINDASVILNITNDTAITANDGSFLLKNISPGKYEIQASKKTYASNTQIADIGSAETSQIDFSLNGIPTPNSSVAFLDFGLDSTSLRFSISNIGKGTFNYFLTPSKDWISITPSTGALASDSVIFVVNINKTGLSESVYKENIKLVSFSGQAELPEIIIPVFLNGVADQDGNYYKVVRIGQQLWMAENLNVGSQIKININSANNEIVEKYCYDNNPENCKNYGGLYQWDEMMQYSPSDNGFTGTTQGICPVDWHIPTSQEWALLGNMLGLGSHSGGKLKETGFVYWLAPNLGADNESGFSALPGSYTGIDLNVSLPLGSQGNWWSATDIALDNTDRQLALQVSLLFNSTELIWGKFSSKQFGFSIRCMKNPD